jgi:uncharacterized DUF497 family protein
MRPPIAARRRRRRKWGALSTGGAEPALTTLFFVTTLYQVKIDFDAAKRELVLRKRGIDFASAAEVFGGRHVTAPDDRRDYGEPRFISVGALDGRAVVVVWTPRAGARRIISMRYAHAKEARRWRVYLDRPG